MNEMMLIAEDVPTPRSELFSAPIKSYSQISTYFLYKLTVLIHSIEVVSGMDTWIELTVTVNFPATSFVLCAIVDATFAGNAAQLRIYCTESVFGSIQFVQSIYLIRNLEQIKRA